MNEGFFSSFKISNIDQLTLALLFRFWVILDLKFSCVFIRYKDTH